ncbi:Aste57867_2487 [Aphanomyces stellatus]|uniref:Aste57867_2487 protein n=1 Tax=Aphanomyces stellatus TaxID=120398 RepID=A0A485K7N3_9STRA|nr:hypothetical protein As57867_002480 [Aphanomyces stellatus]VFT79686.1 Aste57867_2487 [Aphanomyces stellatus]
MGADVRRRVVYLAILSTTMAHNSIECPYIDLPPEVTGIRVWDEALCSLQSLIDFAIPCVVDKTCKQLIGATTYTAVGDMSKSNQSSIGFLDSQTKDFSRVRSFRGINNMHLPSTFQWPQNVVSIEFASMSNVAILSTWPSTLKLLTVESVDNATFPSSYASTLESLKLLRLSHAIMPSTFPPTLKDLVVADCTPFQSLKMSPYSASLDSLFLYNTSVTELNLVGVEYLSLDNNANLTRLSMCEAHRPTTKVVMRNMNIESWTMDSVTFSQLKTSMKAYNFQNSNITTADASECIRRKGTIRELVANDDRVLTVCVLQQELSVGVIGTIVASVVLPCFVLYLCRLKRTLHIASTRAMFQPSRNSNCKRDPFEDQEYACKTALWSDHSLASTQQFPSPSAPGQFWHLSVNENANAQPSAPVLSPLSTSFQANNSPAACTKADPQENDFFGRANAPTSSPSMALPLTTPVKSSFEIESIQERRPHICIVCVEGAQDAACAPCGHNAICMTCAKHLLSQEEPVCPVCHHRIRDIIRIFHG